MTITLIDMLSYKVHLTSYSITSSALIPWKSFTVFQCPITVPLRSFLRQRASWNVGKQLPGIMLLDTVYNTYIYAMLSTGLVSCDMRHVSIKKANYIIDLQSQNGNKQLTRVFSCFQSSDSKGFGQTSIILSDLRAKRVVQQWAFPRDEYCI